MNSSKTKILIVVPTLGDRIDLFKKTLESIKSQKPGLIDLVVVCPEKAIDARIIAKKYNATLVDDPGTLSGALNAGFALANSAHRYASWLGDDDLLEPFTMKKTYDLLESNSNAVIAYGHCRYIDENDRQIFINKPGPYAYKLLRVGPNLVPLIGMLYRMTALKNSGQFDTSLKYTMDLDMLLKIRHYGKFVYTNNTTGSFRWHRTSTTAANRSQSLKEARSVRCRYLPRTLRPLSFLWEVPTYYLTQLASRRLNKSI